MESFIVPRSIAALKTGENLPDQPEISANIGSALGAQTLLQAVMNYQVALSEDKR